MPVTFDLVKLGLFVASLVLNNTLGLKIPPRQEEPETPKYDPNNPKSCFIYVRKTTYVTFERAMPYYVMSPERYECFCKGDKISNSTPKIDYWIQAIDSGWIKTREACQKNK